jgi:dihydroorotate dehydrogenase electron transfer subunit
VTPLQVQAEVAAIRPVGEYFHLTVVAPGIAEQVRPGHFVALAVGGPDSSMLLRRSFSVYRARPTGAHGGTVEIVFAIAGKGTRWLAGVRPGDRLDVVGPLGRPFRPPGEPGTAVLVAGGYGSAPMFGLADAITAAGGTAHFVLGAATAGRLFGVLEARRRGGTVLVTTDDGSAGVRGRVTAVLPDLLDRLTGGAAAHNAPDAGPGRPVTVYACGPMPMLRAVSALAADRGLPSQCAVEEAMACGIGVCMTCVLPVRGADGITRMTRSCLDGPVFDGTAVRWDEVGTVPADTLGAPNPAAAHAAGAVREHGQAFA